MEFISRNIFIGLAILGIGIVFIAAAVIVYYYPDLDMSRKDFSGTLLSCSVIGFLCIVGGFAIAQKKE